MQELKIEKEWTKTSGLNPQPFMFYDNAHEQDGNGRIIAFGSNAALQLLAASDTWMIDGNFKMAPKHFMQLYVIRVPLGETAVSTVYALLERKMQETYRELLHAIMNKRYLYCRPIFLIMESL